MASREQKIRNLRQDLERLRYRQSDLSASVRGLERRLRGDLSDRERRTLTDALSRDRRELANVKDQVTKRAAALRRLENER